MTKVSSIAQRALATGILTITVPEARIVQGEFFSAWIMELQVKKKTTVAMLIQMDPEVSAYVEVSGKIDEDGMMQIFENPTWSDEGEQIPVENHNRVEPDPSSVTCTKNPVITDSGTPLREEALTNAETLGTSFREQWVMKAGNSYLVAVTNLRNPKKDISVHIDFYEPNPEE